MADRELRIRLNVSNPEVLRKLELLKQGAEVNLKLANPELLTTLEDLTKDGKRINLVVDSSSALQSLKALEDKFKRMQELSVISVKVDETDIQGTLKNIQQKMVDSLDYATRTAATRLVAGGYTPENISSALGGTKPGVPYVQGGAEDIIRAAEKLVEAAKGVSRSGADFKRNSEEAAKTVQAQQKLAAEVRESALKGDIARERFLGDFPLIGRGKQETDARIAARLQNQGASSKLIQETLGTDVKRFSFDRLKDLGEKEITELGFAFLSGGGGFGSLARLGGGLAGAASPLGAGGIFLGSALGEIAYEKVSGIFDILVGGVERLTEAGLAFQESVLAISAVLQLTSPIEGVGGIKLSAGEQVAAQRARAEDIQKSARKRLLPLGIAGQAESTIVSAVAEGSGLRGFNLNSEEIAQLSERLGSAAAVVSPSLLNNPSQLRRDITDIVLGLPQAGRTALGAPLRSILSKTNAATSKEEFKEAFKDLDAFKDTLRTSDLAPVQLNRIQGSLGGTATALGTLGLETVGPGLKGLANSLEKIAGPVQKIADKLTDTVKTNNVARKLERERVRELFGPNFGFDPEGDATDAIDSVTAGLGSGRLFANYLTSVIAKATTPDFDKRVQDRIKGTNTQLSTSPLGQGDNLLTATGISPEEIASAGADLKLDPARRAAAAAEAVRLASGEKASAENPTDIIGKIDIRNKAIDAVIAEESQFRLSGLSGKELELSQSRRAAQRRANAAFQDIDFLSENRGIEGQNRQLDNAKDNQRQRLAIALAQGLGNVTTSGDLALQRGLRAQGRISSFDTAGRALAETDAIKSQTVELAKSLNEFKKEFAEKALSLTPEQRSTIEKGIKEAEDTIKEAATRFADSFVRAQFAALDKLSLGVDTQTIGGRDFRLNAQREKTFAELRVAGVASGQAESFANLQRDRGILNNQLGDAAALRGLNRAENQEFIRQGQAEIQRSNLDLQARDLPNKFAELAIKTEELALNMEEAAASAKEFKASAELRQLGREGTALSAIKKLSELDPFAANSLAVDAAFKSSNIDFSAALSGGDSKGFEARLARAQAEKAVRDLTLGQEADARQEKLFDIRSRRADIAQSRLPGEFTKLVNESNQIELSRLSALQAEEDARVNLASQRLGVFQRFAGTKEGERVLGDIKSTGSAEVLGIDPTVLESIQSNSKIQIDAANKANKDLGKIAESLTPENIKKALTTALTEKGLSGSEIKEAIDGVFKGP